MPYGYAGRCYETTAEALEAFRVSFPIFGDTYVQTLQSASVVPGGSVLYTVGVRPVQSATVTSRSGSFVFQSCSDVVPPFDAATAGAIFAFFFLGVAGSWVVAQNAGLILQAIKKW